MKVGTIIFCNAYPGSFLSKAIRFFTNSNLTHAMYSVEDYMNRQQVFSAEINMEVLPYDSFSWEQQFLYEWIGVDEQFLINTTRDQVKQWVGDGYAILRFTWFMWVWLVKKLGRKDVKKMNNWFPRHNECGTLASRMIYEVACEVACKYFPDLKLELDQWYIENINQYDLYQIVNKYPNIFKFVGRVN